MATTNNQQRMATLAKKIDEEVKRSAGKGLNAARIFLAARVKEALSVPAPRRRVSPPGGIPYYRATTPATVGAPPRKLSGKLRSSVSSQMVGPLQAAVGCNARSDAGFGYGKYHEEHDHPFLAPTAERYKDQLATIVGQEVGL